MTGWFVAALLRRLGLPQRWALVYLWNPLVIVEFAHGAHVDALMLCLMMISLWASFAKDGSQSTENRMVGPYSLLSVAAMVGATLTKGVPALLMPVLVWRWGWRRTLLYVSLAIALLLPIGFGIGWGMMGPRDGEGLFGALRIYGAQWNYNSGLYHWLEVGLSGYRTPGAVPPEIVGKQPIRLAKLIMASGLGLVLLGVAWKSRGMRTGISLLQLAIVPFAAYLLLTTTLHPWYVTVLIPLLPFWLAADGETVRSQRFPWPWIVFSILVGLSYLTYLDPANLREYDWVRLAEYVPLYLLLIWAAWPAGSGDRL
jgi:hypothetical protein